LSKIACFLVIDSNCIKRMRYWIGHNWMSAAAGVYIVVHPDG